MEEDDVVVPQQNAIKFFLNTSQEIVIQEEDEYSHDGFRFVAFSAIHAEKIISAIRLCKRSAS